MVEKLIFIDSENLKDSFTPMVKPSTNKHVFETKLPLILKVEGITSKFVGSKVVWGIKFSSNENIYEVPNNVAEKYYNQKDQTYFTNYQHYFVIGKKESEDIEERQHILLPLFHYDFSINCQKLKSIWFANDSENTWFRLGRFHQNKLLTFNLSSTPDDE